MTRQVTLPAGPASLTFQTNYDIEDCGPDPCDYAYVEVNDGSGYKAIPGSITKAAEGNGIDGTSAGWVPATFDLSAYAGKTIGLQLHYATDGGAGGKGLFVDDLKVTSGATTVLTSGAETSPEGWTLGGFSSAGASITTLYDNYYIATNINYTSYDANLKTGPYNFGWVSTAPDKIEHFPYEQGLLIWYVDTSVPDNNTSVHPGSGRALPIDSRPVPINRLDGTVWRPRVSAYDAPFGLTKAASFNLHVNGQVNYIRGQNAVPTFNDSKSYWSADLPTSSVKIPNNGVNIKVTGQSGTSMTVKVSKRS
jgi:immune inhibitor A